MNRRGEEVGFIITFVPSMILVFIIMAGFVGLSYLVAVAKSSANSGAVNFADAPALSSVNGDSVLFKSYTGKDEKAYSVIDMIVGSVNLESDRSVFLGFESLVNSKNNCLALAVGWKPFGSTNSLDYYKIDFVKLSESSGKPFFYSSPGPYLTKYKKAGKLVETSFVMKVHRPVPLIKLPTYTNDEYERVYVSYYYGGCLE